MSGFGIGWGYLGGDGPPPMPAVSGFTTEKGLRVSDWGRRKGRLVIGGSGRRISQRRSYTARAMTTCRRCLDTIDVGDHIVYWGRGVVHTGCAVTP